MFQRYFVYDGKTYKSGTIVKMKLLHPVLKTTSEEYMIFGSVSGNNLYACREPVSRGWHYFSEENFFKSLVEVADKVCADYTDRENKNIAKAEKYSHMPTFKEQMDIDGLGLAWVWYIFIMAVITIFNDRIGLWILASVIFFGYRKRKLREKGYKV